MGSWCPFPASTLNSNIKLPLNNNSKFRITTLNCSRFHKGRNKCRVRRASLRNRVNNKCCCNNSNNNCKVKWSSCSSYSNSIFCNSNNKLPNKPSLKFNNILNKLFSSRNNFNSQLCSNISLKSPNNKLLSSKFRNSNFKSHNNKLFSSRFHNNRSSNNSTCQFRGRVPKFKVDLKKISSTRPTAKALNVCKSIAQMISA